MVWEMSSDQLGQWFGGAIADLHRAMLRRECIGHEHALARAAEREFIKARAKCVDAIGAQATASIVRWMSRSLWICNSCSTPKPYGDFEGSVLQFKTCTQCAAARKAM